ncbi:MAG TPA: DUF3626 domain-containing protein [Trinickia sp.]|jgi:hypothetical protein|uniref:DUF3626 domain-containing protein n=1 Tax=Trinickia sp. TaxID=2571163 RepID=UPI002CA75A02|nr:DUF3626 domain-containing protein [Trinickia sp.]HTI18104.1 DUF3626 domain-containing protein [Trinickia sp.]
MPIDYGMHHAALARMARNGVVGLRDMAEKDIDYKEAAFKRFVTLCEPRASEGQARRLFDGMVQVLQEARLTINFDSSKWFGQANSAGRYSNMFERIVGPSTSKNTVGQLRERNTVEKRMMDFGGQATRPLAPPNAQHIQKVLAYYGDTGIDRHGLPTSNSFDPSVRPRYGAVDFGYCRFGAAGDHRYGHSFFILKEHVKHNATYTHTDSFKVEEDLAKRRAEYGGRAVSLHDATATYFQLEKILLYCTPSMLQNIYDYATGRKERGKENALPVDTTAHWVNYLEFQAHSEIEFHRDVEAMVLYRPETRASRGYVGYQAEKRAREFAQRNGIPLKVIEYDPAVQFKRA